jgi:ribosomal protein S12 methylthiotransferase
LSAVALHNLGCSKNQIDGERILCRLRDAGFSVVSDFSRADIILVNTCAFIQEAKQEAIDAILELSRYKKTGRCGTLAVCGCFSERFRHEAKKHFPEVDLWMGVHDWPKLLGASFHTPMEAGTDRVLFPPVATQYLKIAEGCSHRCSFCVIPSVRGAFKSRSEKDVLAEAAWLESCGVKECILVAQDTSSYGRDRGSSLVRLLELLLAKTSFPWIRLMYLHPAYVTDGLLRLVAAEKRLCPYFDIPLQHISDTILSSMKRRPLSKGIRDLIGRIRALVPGAAIRTTFIAGFPGETERHFSDLLSFVEESKFERVGVFPFSPEEGTPAAGYGHRPRNPTIVRRCDMLMSLQRRISGDICASRVGSTISVIVEPGDQTPAATTGGFVEARSVWDAPEVDGKVLIANGGRLRPGDIVPVSIVSAKDYDLVAEPS